MADYVSILKRTLDNLGSSATPALRERVYTRAREAVRRQLDGMNPPPADEVMTKHFDALESAIAEVEAGYDTGAAPPEGSPPDAGDEGAVAERVADARAADGRTQDGPTHDGRTEDARAGDDARAETGNATSETGAAAGSGDAGTADVGVTGENAAAGGRTGEHGAGADGTATGADGIESDETRGDGAAPVGPAAPATPATDAGAVSGTAEGPDAIGADVPDAPGDAAGATSRDGGEAATTAGSEEVSVGPGSGGTMDVSDAVGARDGGAPDGDRDDGPQLSTIEAPRYGWPAEAQDAGEGAGVGVTDVSFRSEADERARAEAAARESGEAAGSASLDADAAEAADAAEVSPTVAPDAADGSAVVSSSSLTLRPTDGGAAGGPVDGPDGGLDPSLVRPDLPLDAPADPAAEAAVAGDDAGGAAASAATGLAAAGGAALAASGLGSASEASPGDPAPGARAELVPSDEAGRPSAGRLADEALPGRALIGLGGDPVLDPDKALPLGEPPALLSPAASGAGDAGAFAAGSALSLASGARNVRGGPASTDGAAGEPGAAGGEGGLDPSLFERPDYEPGGPIDAAGPEGAARPGPPASTLATHAGRMPHAASLEPDALGAEGVSLPRATGLDDGAALPGASDADGVPAQKADHESAIRLSDGETGGPLSGERRSGTPRRLTDTPPTARARRSRSGAVLAGLGVAGAVLAGGWFLRDDLADATGVEGFRTAFGLEDVMGGDGMRDGPDGPDPDAQDGVDDPRPDDSGTDLADRTSDENEAPTGESDVADAGSGERTDGPDEPTFITPRELENGETAGNGSDDGAQTADAGDAAPDATVPDPDPSDPDPSDPGPSDADLPDPQTSVPASGPQKFTKRLLPDGSEIDVAMQDTDIATRPVPVTPTDGNGDPLSSADGTPADGTTGDGAATTLTPGTVEAGDARAVLVGEPVGGATPDRSPGAVAWSVVNERPGADLPPEPAIRGIISLEDGTELSVTVRRNADTTLPASHLIELVFDIPEDAAGPIQSLPLVGFKGTLGTAARPLVAVPAKITDAYFLVGLNNLATAVESNLELMGEEDFMDVQLVYGNGRRATLTVEKGAKGDEVFDEVLAAWRDTPLPG